MNLPVVVKTEKAVKTPSGSGEVVVRSLKDLKRIAHVTSKPIVRGDTKAYVIDDSVTYVATPEKKEKKDKKKKKG